MALLKLIRSSHWKAIKSLLHTMLLAGLALWIALLVPFFYFVQHSRALQPRPLPSVQKFANGRRTNVLLVVAHPDDESMFFGPTLLSLAQLDLYNIRALCFSTGNADGLGSVRKSEMATACSVLKIPTENVDVVDHPALQDGFSSLWDQSLIVKLLRQTVADHHIQVVLTFDNHGISGHPNHCAVHNGVRAFLLEEGKATKGKEGSVKGVVQGWELISTNILRKYSGPLELCAPLLKRFFSHDDKVHHLANPSPWTSIVAMSQHKSQWVWVWWIWFVTLTFHSLEWCFKINPDNAVLLGVVFLALTWQCFDLVSEAFCVIFSLYIHQHAKENARMNRCPHSNSFKCLSDTQFLCATLRCAVAF